MSHTIDYLFEDPPIPNQKFALISIVGPNMQQKCDVWGLKVRGIAENIEKSKALCKKLMKIDNNYDIYTVEVGKFFPLNVEPHDINDIEYQNDQLNVLIKTYLENRELANEQWLERKNKLVQDAIREGKSQDELAKKPEHPIAVLQRIKTFEDKIKNLQEELQMVEKDLDLSKQKFMTYTEEEKQLAQNEFISAVQNNTDIQVPVDSEMSVDDIRKQLLSDLDTNQTFETTTSTSPIDSILGKLKPLEKEQSEIQAVLSTITQESSPNTFKKLSDNLSDINKQIEELRVQLTSSSIINDYINSNYQNSEFEHLNE
jgi:hypothetical protein